MSTASFKQRRVLRDVEEGLLDATRGTSCRASTRARSPSRKERRRGEVSLRQGLGVRAAAAGKCRRHREHVVQLRARGRRALLRQRTRREQDGEREHTHGLLLELACEIEGCFIAADPAGSQGKCRARRVTASRPGCWPAGRNSGPQSLSPRPCALSASTTARTSWRARGAPPGGRRRRRPHTGRVRPTAATGRWPSASTTQSSQSTASASPLNALPAARRAGAPRAGRRRSRRRSSRSRPAHGDVGLRLCSITP